jgi:hypothetical protein
VSSLLAYCRVLVFARFRRGSVRIQFFAQLLHASMKIHADRTVREASFGGDFRAGHAFDQPQNESFSIGFR